VSLQDTPSVSAAGADRLLHSFAAEPYCIAVNGGFGFGGTTFVARNFSQPGEGKCTPWTGYTKTADTVILTTSGKQNAEDRFRADEIGKRSTAAAVRCVQPPPITCQCECRSEPSRTTG
jgi:hypothetical protein